MTGIHQPFLYARHRVSAYFWEQIFREVSNPKKDFYKLLYILGLFFPYPFQPTS